jgi:DNA-binding beta-propeller fold protein YncE
MKRSIRSVMTRSRLGVACGLVLVAWFVVDGRTMTAQSRPQTSGARLSGGNGTMYIGSYPDTIAIIDEATEKITGRIHIKSGIPRRLGLSTDKTRFYVIEATNERVEIIDIASKTTIDQFTLTEGNKRVRIAAIEPDPTHRYAILITRTATKLRDHVEIGPSQLQQYDLKEHKIMRTIPWPDGEERDSANLMFSPDGKLLYFLGNEVLIFETENFTQVDKWDMSNLEEGLGQVSVSFGGFGGLDTTNDEPGFLTTTMTVEDPVQHRRMMGVAKINLTKKEMEFYTIGPAGGVNFVLSPDHKLAYGLESAVGRYQFWTFDLERRMVTSRQEFDGRPRMSLKTSSNGKLLYIYTAGHTIDVYDGANYKYLRTIELDGDMTTQFYVLPRAAGAPAATAARP